MSPDFAEKVQGVILGTAVGDALGYPVEFLSMDSIRVACGDQGVTGFGRFHERKVFEGPHQWSADADDRPVDVRTVYQYSDDTQMLIATLEGLLRARTWDDVDAAAEEVAAEYVAWSISPENNRAPGRACMHGCASLEQGANWRLAGKPDGKGCGTAMRSMAYGIWHFDDPDRAASWAAQHALMTHRSREAMASAAMVAAGVASLFQGASMPDAAEKMLYVGHRYSPAMVSRIDEVVEVSFLSQKPETVLNRWRGWTGEEAVGASMYCALRHPMSFSHAVLEAVNSPGDSDSLGAITGALVGANVGVSTFKQWAGQVENSDRLVVLSERVIDAMASRGATLCEK